MKMGIVGLPQSGKTTLFSLIAGKSGSMTGKGDRKIAIAYVRDKRLDKLHEFYPPAKKIYAAVEFLLVPSITKDPQDRKKSFSLMAEANAVLFVVRAFQNDAVYHIDTVVDPSRDIKTLIDEMILYDLELIEKRLINIKKDLKKNKLNILLKEQNLLNEFQKTLEEEQPLRELEIDQESLKMIKGFNFLTLKPIVILLNVNEDQIEKKEILDKITLKFGSENVGILQFCAPIEQEISELEDKDEREVFLKDLGFDEPAVERTIKVSYTTLGYLSFFTIGDDEVRAWTVKEGALAPTAAGVIHSDLERGFIRAEVIKFDDFIALNGENECKKAGKSMLKGKDYVVEDGDIINIRFNV